MTGLSEYFRPSVPDFSEVCSPEVLKWPSSAGLVHRFHRVQSAQRPRGPRRISAVVVKHPRVRWRANALFSGLCVVRARWASLQIATCTERTCCVGMPGAVPRGVFLREHHSSVRASWVLEDGSADDLNMPYMAAAYRGPLAGAPQVLTGDHTTSWSGQARARSGATSRGQDRRV